MDASKVKKEASKNKTEKLESGVQHDRHKTIPFSPKYNKRGLNVKKGIAGERILSLCKDLLRVKTAAKPVTPLVNLRLERHSSERASESIVKECSWFDARFMKPPF